MANKIICWLCISIALFAGCQQRRQVDAQQKPTVELQPFKGFPGHMLPALKDSLEALYPIRVIVKPSIPLPAQAYYAPRKRYRADTLIRCLSGWCKGRSIVGLSVQDISTTKEQVKDYGVMGLGFQPGRACVVSLFRLKPTSTSAQQLQQRLYKVVAHELGHNFGLPHCNNDTCIMTDAEGKMKLDGEKNLCSSCKEKYKMDL